MVTIVCVCVCVLQLRMYRVVWFYQWCEYSSNIKLLWLTLFRNMSVGSQTSWKRFVIMKPLSFLCCMVIVAA